MTRNRWITPDDTGEIILARCLSVPEHLQPAVNGALQMLTYSSNWEQVGDLTPEECAAAMVDVLSSYYSSEGCSSMDTPDRQLIFWIEGKNVAGNALALNLQSTHVFNSYWKQEPGAINDIMEFSVLLQSGVYDLTIVGTQQGSNGIQHWIIDGVEDGQTIDMRGSTTANFTATISVEVLTSGLHTIQCKMSTKHASSSGYGNNMTYFKLLRTGDLP